jgi:hypothetical protein
MEAGCGGSGRGGLRLPILPAPYHRKSLPVVQKAEAVRYFMAGRCIARVAALATARSEAVTMLPSIPTP